ncbi:MAG: NAD(P)H-dependent oxidoreductase [Alphaproteobacteria bacterium]|nr:NAD(P)H-dependent oxidoreductase [Alphaproteobacteria bacterium]
MSDTVKVLVFAGSARKDSWNKKLAAVAAQALERHRVTATLVDLNNYTAPVYHGDLEAENGVPETMQAFKTLLFTHDAMMIASPEYNGCVPPVLNNLFAWCSRAEGEEAASAAFSAKPFALMAASPSRRGGVRMIPRLRDILAELGAVATPGFVTLPHAEKAFAADGTLLSEQTLKTLDGLITRLLYQATYLEQFQFTRKQE